MGIPLLFHGPVITPHSHYLTKYLPHALLCVEDGIIKWIEEEVSHDSDIKDILHKKGLQGVDVRKIKKGEFLIPGFVDTHTHAPQFNNLASGGQLQLLDWLEIFTFPLESKFGDKAYAEKNYSRVVRRLLDCGTTTCCYFGTTHLVGNTVLADVAKTHGQRAFIGQCNMNRNAPKTLMDASTEESLQSTRAIISHIDSLGCSLVRPILTPRFAISCTEDLLRGLGDLARENFNAPYRLQDHPHGLPIQTHLSENLSEIEFTKSLFPSAPNYTSIYDNYGLLGPTTILAHCCHISHEEVMLIKERGAGLSHCPTSNFNLTSGVARVGEWLDEGVKVGLGTDVSGGFSPSMLTAIRHASMASKVLAMEVRSAAQDGPEVLSSTSAPRHIDTPAELSTEVLKPFANRPLPVATLLYLSTLGGAELCNLEAVTGSLAQGKAFDAILVSLRPEQGNPSVWWEDEDYEMADRSTKTYLTFLENSLERFFFCGDDRNINGVWVEGNLVGGREYHGLHLN